MQDLSSYSLDVIAPVLEKIGQEAPADFKQLWPAVGTILEAIRAHIRANLPSAEQAAASRWLKYIGECKAEGIEQPDAEMLMRIEKLNARFDLNKPKEIIIGPPQMVTCPHCQGILPLAKNLHSFRSKDLRMLADVVEKSELIAAENRAKVHAPATETVDAISEECI